MDSADRKDDPEDGRKVPVAAMTSDVGFLAKAIEAAGVGILALDRRTGGVAYVNAAGAGTLRLLSDASRADALEAFTRSMLAEGERVPAEGSEAGRTLTIGERVVGYTLYPGRDELWAFFRDVTEKVRLSSVAESLQLSDALLGVFAALRHDVGNSVNAAKTSLHVLRQGLGRFDEDAIRRYVDRSLEALSGVESVLGTLRDYGFTSRPRLRTVFVGEVVEGVALECGRNLADRGTALDLEIEEGTARVLADPGSLEEALCVLVSRAETRARSSEKPRVLVRVETRRDTVVVRVSPGVEAGAPPLVAAYDDLRLLVVRRLVAQMQGTFEVDGADAVVVLRRARETG